MSARALSHVALWMAMLMSCVFASRTRAEPELSLAWPTRADCPDQTHVLQRIEAQLARKLGEGGVTLRADALIARDEAGYRLTLRTERGKERGERVFQAASCAEVSNAAALLIALTAEAPAPVPFAVEPAPPSAPPSPSYLLRAGAVAERGSLPRITAGAELAVALAWQRAQAGLAVLWLPAVYSERNAQGARVSATLWTTRASYCHDLVGRRLHLLGCAGAELGRATGRGNDLRDPSARHYFWGAGFASLRVVSELTQQLHLYLEPGLAVPIVRRRYTSRSGEGQRDEVLHTPSVVSARLGFGAQIAF
jgi:hypothetical protein